MWVRKKIKLILNSVEYKCRFFGKKISVHPSSYVSWKATIKNSGEGKIFIGENCEIHSFSLILSYGGKIKIGNNCSLNPFSIIYGHGGVEIGNSVRIASHSVIIPANHNVGNSAKALHESGVNCKGIVIEDNVWLGSGCRILDGVKVGKNSVVAAGAVVSKTVESNTIVGGVPARFLKKV